MPITMLQLGETKIIKKINGKDETRHFLENLGLVAGSSVTLISEMAGNVIICVRDTRVAISKAMANKIIIGDWEMRTLKEVKIGESVKVVKLSGEGALKRRIMDMGITKGVEVFLRKTAPLGDPIEVTVRGYELSLRKADAEMIVVE